MTAMIETNPDYSRQMYEPQYNSHRPPDPPVKEEAARQRREEIMRRQSPTRQPPQSDMYDHNQMSQHLREERRREYNDFLDPRSQHNGDYNDMNDQKENETHNRTPPTPPVGLNIPTEAERLRITELRKRQYGADLRRQHQEQILNRAQNQVDMPVLDRRNQSPVRDAYNSPSVPPLGLDRRPPSGRWDPESYRQTNYAPVKRLSSPPHQANIGADDYSEYRRKVERDSRNSEYNQFLARKQVEDDARKQKMNEVRRQPAAPVVKGDYYDSESYDLKRQYLMEEKHKEYQNYLKKINQKSESAGRSPTPTNLGLPLSQNEYDSRRKHLELERNKEYNELLAKKGEPFARYDMRNRSDNESPRAKGVELSVRSDLQDQKQGDLQPRKPYNPNGPENRIGFMANLGTSLDRQRESLAHQRHEEYNNFLKDRYALHGKPQGRPSWVDRQVLPDSWYKPSIQRNDDRTSKTRDERPDDRPGSQRRSGTNQSYEDMLQAKRRQEANYRREDYHDYSRPGDRY